MSRLLVVDDERAIQDAFKRTFRDSNIQLTLANSSADAMEKIAREKPDAVVLDVNLPDTAWPDILRRIRAHEARIPVVLIAGLGTGSLPIDAIKEVAHDDLLQPLELPQLRELIDLALDSSRRTRVPAVLPEDKSAAAEPSDVFDWDQFINRRIAARCFDLYSASLERMEREVLMRVLQHTGGNQLQAAKILGITRGTLRGKIRHLGIYFTHAVWSRNGQSES